MMVRNGRALLGVSPVLKGRPGVRSGQEPQKVLKVPPTVINNATNSLIR